VGVDDPRICAFGLKDRRFSVGEGLHFSCALPMNITPSDLRNCLRCGLAEPRVISCARGVEAT
jgi:hypothetical protein